MDYVSVLGFIAAALTAVSSIPQALKIVRTKETEQVSTRTYVILLTGLILWVIYGVLKSDWPVIVANSISAVSAGSVLFLKLISKKTLDEIHKSVHQ